MRDTPSGNIEAFGARLAAMRPKLHRYCGRMTGSAIDGEDVVQEAMIRALAAFPAQQEIANAEAWVFRIAHNCALDLLRRRARQDEWLSDEPVEAIADPAPDAEHRVAAAASLATFMQLVPAQRAAVILMDVLGYSLQEIATILDASVAAVKASLHRGRTRLRELVDQGGAAAPPALDAADLKLLSAYVDRFNAHDFDAIRAMLAEDVRLDLVNRTQAVGRAAVSRYFGNYDSATDWRLGLGLLDGRPAIVVRDRLGEPAYVIAVAWADGAVTSIRDFRYARYVVETAEIRSLP